MKAEHMAEIKRPGGMPKKGHREVESVSYRPAKGGIISETRHKTFRGGQGGGPNFDWGSDDAVHPSMEHAMKHLKSMMGSVFGEAQKDGENEPAKGETKPKKETPGPKVKADEPSEAAEVKEEDD